MSVGDTSRKEEPEVIYDFDPSNLPPEYLQAVGLVVMASAQTESVMQDFIGGLVGADLIETMALTSRMSAPLKDKIVRALVELNAATADIVDDIDDLLDAIEEAMTRRNQIVHNPLIRNPSTGAVISHRLKERGSLRLELRAISVEEIQDDARLLYKVGMDLYGFMMMTGLQPGDRGKPFREPLNRAKKARAERRNLAAGKIETVVEK